MYKNLSAPTSCQLELTTLCNHNCIHCYNFWRHGQGGDKNKTLTKKEIECIVGKLTKAKVFSIVITGGEPFVEKEMLSFCVDKLTDSDVWVSINSNLTILDKTLLKSFYKKGVKNILTSLLGPNEKIHDYITQRQGSFNKIRRNIKIAIDSGMNIVVNMVVSKLNKDSVIETAELVSDLGVKVFSITKAGCPGNCADFSEYSLSKFEFDKHIEDIYKIKKQTNLDISVLEAYPLCGINNPVSFMKIVNRRCNAGISDLTIASNGDVRPCSHLDINYGNLLKEELSVIWDRMIPFRRGDFLPELCKECNLLLLCGGGCRMEAKTSSKGDISAKDPFCLLENIENHTKNISKAFFSGGKEDLVIDSFRLKKNLRFREEDFGAVVVRNDSSQFFLNKKGFSVFQQLNQNGKIFDIKRNNIDWRGLDPINFVSGLYKKDVVVLTE
ncbi:radical SAM protein [Patescibacteria group bacterium]|nr:radical SAM protein [Patescibacteria group bacterium]